MKIKKGDKVKVLSGKDRGRLSTVIAVFPKFNKVLVKGVNIVKKHKKVKEEKGIKKTNILSMEAPLSASKLLVICPKCEKGTRIYYKIENKKKFRVCKKCNEKLDDKIKKNEQIKGKV